MMMYKLLLPTLATLFLQANMLPQNVLSKNCLESYKNSYLSQKDHKAFVYAREKETDKDRCNWAYGYDATKEAIDSSMKGCQSVLLNAECTLVDTDGVFEVKEGTFSRLTPVDDTPLSAEEKEKMIEQAKGLILGNCLPFFTKNYLDAKGHKSFGYSIDANGNYACGYSYQNQTEKISQKQAIKSCNDNKAKRGNKAPKSPCKVYATNKQILLGAKDFGIKIEPKKDIFLDEDAYAERLTKAKEIIGNNACLMQIKYYLRGKTQQAYYFVKSGDKQACGRKEEAFSLKEAKKEAKKACEKMAKEQGIKHACKLLAENYEIVGKASDFETVAKESKDDFMMALKKGNLKKIKKYIAKGYDVNTKENKNGATPLFVAAIKGDAEFFNTLVKKGANINHKLKDASNLLVASVAGKHANIEIVKTLLERRIDVNAKGFGGNTALHLACMGLNEDAIKLLLSHGADKSIKNDKDMSSEQILKDMKIDINTFIKKKKRTPPNHTTSNAMPVMESMKIAVKTLNKNLPKMTDEETRLDSVSAEKSKMIYHLTLVHLTSWSMPFLKLKSLLYKDLKSQICNDRDSRMLLKKGVSISYRYSDKDARPIGAFDFDAKTCGLTTNLERIKRNILHMIKK
jgi:hypothetical protein